MKLRFLLSFLLIISLNIAAYCQQILDTVNVRVIYNYSYKTINSEPDYVRRDLFFLDIGEKVSKFYSRNNQIIDSIRSVLSDKGESVDAIRKSTDARAKGSASIYCDFINENKRWETKKWGYFYAYYEEDRTLPMWNIHSEGKEISSYQCQRATTNYKGRNWEVFFTTELQLNTGPWKLWGLPGLILQANDSEKLFLFEFAGIQFFPNKNINISNPIKGRRKYKKLSYQEFRKTDQLYYHEPMVFMQNVLRLTVHEKQNSKKKSSIPHIPLEPW